MYQYSAIIKSRFVAVMLVLISLFSTHVYAEQQLLALSKLEHTNQALSAKIGAMAKLDPALTRIYRQQAVAADSLLTAHNPHIRLIDDGVLIDAVAVAAETQRLQLDLQALGMSRSSSFGRVVSGIIPLAALENLAALKSLQFARPAMAMTMDGGLLLAKVIVPCVLMKHVRRKKLQVVASL